MQTPTVKFHHNPPDNSHLQLRGTFQDLLSSAHCIYFLFMILGNYLPVRHELVGFYNKRRSMLVESVHGRQTYISINKTCY